MNTINIIYYTGNNFVGFSVALNLTLDVAGTVSCMQLYSINVFSIQNTQQEHHMIVTCHCHLLLFISNIMIYICKITLLTDFDIFSTTMT